MESNDCAMKIRFEKVLPKQQYITRVTEKKRTKKRLKKVRRERERKMRKQGGERRKKGGKENTGKTIK